MSKVPPIPAQQRTDKGPTQAHPHPAAAGARSAGHGNAGTNLKEQGRFGNIHQNTHNQGYQQDR